MAPRKPKNNQDRVVRQDTCVEEHRAGIAVRAAMKRYGTYVIEDRSLPDIRDGLKPSQRRLLYGMNELGITPNNGFKKSARITGYVMGALHPHGSAYSTLVTLTKTRYAFVRPQGNFGNGVDGAAAERYTEVGLNPISDSLFDCLGVADMVPNYSGEFKEPLILNTRLPVLLMNGTGAGIAVGTSTLLPSHNLKELVDAFKYLIRAGNKATTAGLLDYIQGPDCTEGGVLLSDKSELLAMYESGKGSLRYSCSYEIGPDPYDARVTEIKITGWPDKWSPGGFLGKTVPKLLANKTILRSEADYGENVFNSISLFVDNKIALETVLKRLRCQASYAFNVTVRGTNDESSFRASNLLDIMRTWLSWRQSEEVKMLQKERGVQVAKWRSEKIRLFAILNIKIIAAALNQDREDVAEYLCRELRQERDIIDAIMSLRVADLKRADVAAQERRIEAIGKTIAGLDADLQNPLGVVSRELDKLSRYYDERRTKIGESSLVQVAVKTTGVPVAYGVTPEGKIFGNLQSGRSTPQPGMIGVGAFAGITLVNTAGLALCLNPSEADGKAGGKVFESLAGVASNDAPYLLGVCVDGCVVKLKTDARPGEFSACKTALVWAGSGMDNSKIIAWGRDGRFASVQVSKLQENRRNGRGIKVFDFKPVTAIVVHEGQKWYSGGQQVLFSGLGEAGYGNACAVAKHNLVLFTTGKRLVCDASTAVEATAEPGFQSCWPLSLPET